MKVCLVSPYDFTTPGGVGEHVRHLAEQLRERHHDVTVMAPSNELPDDHGIPGYVRIGRSVPMRGNGSVARIGLSFHLVRRVRQLLDAEGFDVVHYHEPLVPALPITVLRFHHGANVGTFHSYARRNLGYYYGRPFLKRYFKRLDACIAVSAPARDFVARYFVGEYRIVPNGIETARFSPELPPLPELRTNGQRTILSVGRLEQRKGVPVLLEAYAELRRRRADCRLVVVGEGELRWQYERWVENEKVPDVLFTGHVDGRLLPRCYTSADIFCAPAVGGESFGIVLLEAMASGRAVIASGIPGFAQVISDGSDGVLTRAGDVAAWAATIARLLDDDSMRGRLGAAGVVTARRYDWSHVVDQVLDVYAQARARARTHRVAAGVHEPIPGMD
ncbi:MAG TPA: glycosyltransferase family 4 protein [Candidatus Dormibacteraeota bacterium]